jgi:hypothetical protein
MRIIRNIASLGGILIVLTLFPSTMMAYVTRPDSQQLTQLLMDAKDEAIELANDADETQALSLSDDNWVTHALTLSKVKVHVDNMALIIGKLSEAQKSGSELQEQAVQQMLPLVRELSANTTAAINYLKQNKSRPDSEAYQQYLKKNAEAAHQLSSMISALLEYENSMTEIEQLRSKLVASGESKP